MKEDYLWDRTGEPDADVAHLEEVLGTLRWSKARSGSTVRRPAARQMPRWLAAAAILLVGMGTSLFVHKAHTASAPTSWKLSLDGEKPKPMRAGELIETKAGAVGSIESDLVGKIDIDPDSQVRLLASRGDEARLGLGYGTIHAFIWAPPEKFIVDTPSAKTVDLGCKYTLRVAKSGTGLLTVEMGWVAFESHGIESFIPAGAACTTRLGFGPDTPYFLDASAQFKNAVAEFDLRGSRQALQSVVAMARERDGLTLWHLLQRTHGDERGEVFGRLAELLKLPPAVTRDAILKGDRTAMDATWNALQLGDTDWWREWKRRW